MSREVRGGSAAGRASTAQAAPAAPSSPVRKSRRYGAVTAATPLNRDLSFDHMAAASEQGYLSLPRTAEEPTSAEGGRGCARLLRRVVVGCVVITLFAAAVSTLYGGHTSSESGVRGVLSPKMAAEVSTEMLFPGAVPVFFVSTTHLYQFCTHLDRVPPSAERFFVPFGRALYHGERDRKGPLLPTLDGRHVLCGRLCSRQL